MVFPFAAALAGAGTIMDIAGGIQQRREQKKLWQQFTADLARREQESLTLERVARGEIRASLADSRQLFGRTIQALSAGGGNANRRVLETIAYREAEAKQQMLRRGLLGSSMAADAAAQAERETFRAALDAQMQTSQSIAQVLAQQAGFEFNAGQTLADSFRREAQIGATTGREMRSALENTQVSFTPTTGALSALGAELQAFFGSKNAPKSDGFSEPGNLTANGRSF